MIQDAKGCSRGIATRCRKLGERSRWTNADKLVVDNEMKTSERPSSRPLRFDLLRRVPSLV